MMSVGKAALVEFMKKHIRISAENIAMNDEVSGLIDAAIDDMKMRGVDADRLFPEDASVSGMSPLAVRAVVYYCKANFGVSISVDESNTFFERYDGITQSMSHSADYMIVSGGDD